MSSHTESSAAATTLESGLWSDYPVPSFTDSYVGPGAGPGSSVVSAHPSTGRLTSPSNDDIPLTRLSYGALSVTRSLPAPTTRPFTSFTISRNSTLVLVTSSRFLTSALNSIPYPTAGFPTVPRPSSPTTSYFSPVNTSATTSTSSTSSQTCKTGTTCAWKFGLGFGLGSALLVCLVSVLIRRHRRTLNAHASNPWPPGNINGSARRTSTRPANNTSTVQPNIISPTTAGFCVITSAITDPKPASDEPIGGGLSTSSTRPTPKSSDSNDVRVTSGREERHICDKIEYTRLPRDVQRIIDRVEEIRRL